MRTSYYDKRSIVVQLTAAGMDAHQAEVVANLLRHSRNPAVTKPELNAALLKVVLGIIVVNFIVAVVLIKVL